MPPTEKRSGQPPPEQIDNTMKKIIAGLALVGAVAWLIMLGVQKGMPAKKTVETSVIDSDVGGKGMTEEVVTLHVAGEVTIK